MSTAPADVATAVLETVPAVMRRIRSEMRAAATPTLTVPQMRALMFIGRHPETNLSALAEHLGIGLTGASGLVDRLVRDNLVARDTDPHERRKIRLTVTAAGQARRDQALSAARRSMTARLAGLSSEELATVNDALRILRSLPEEPR